MTNGKSDLRLDYAVRIERRQVDAFAAMVGGSTAGLQGQSGALKQ